MFDERETPIEEEKYFIARIYVPLSIESLGVHKFRISEKIRINPMFDYLESPIEKEKDFIEIKHWCTLPSKNA